MTKTHKAVLKSSFVMLVLFAVAGSGVAQAQECIARGSSVMVRAEGITEAIGTVELACQEPSGLGFGSPEVLEITVELNTAITSVIDNDRVVAGLTYTEIDGAVGTDDIEDDDFEEPAGVDAAAATLSDDGTAITWKIYSATLDLGPTGDDGFQVTIGGIKANASMMGDGEDVTAVVSVQGAAVHSGSLKVADVTTGLLVEVEAADVLQCDTDIESETATIKLQEGYVNSITVDNDLMVSFTGIPEGVTVIVPGTVAAVDTVDIGLELQNDPRVSGVTVDDEGRNIVDLSASGSGAVVYDVTGTDDTLAEESVDLPVTFKWEAGDVVDSGEVDVSFHPVSTMGGDTYSVNGAPPERYVASGSSHTVIDVSPCLTTLLFPFVTNQHMFDTGVVITNASEQSGSCTVQYSGANAPEDMTSQPIAEGAQWIGLASTVAPTFQGYITATCSFRDAHGFAFLTDGYGGTPTLAQSYLAVCISDDCPGR